MSSGYAEGYERGVQEGRRAGEAEGRIAASARSEEALRRALLAHEAAAQQHREALAAEQQADLHRLQQICADVESAQRARQAAQHRDAAALAFEAVCQLLGERHGDAEHIARCVGHALGKLAGTRLLRVRLRPETMALLADSPEGRSLLSSDTAVEWVVDTRIRDDGCILDTDSGSVDARLDVQVANLRDLWSKTVQTKSADPWSSATTT